MSYNPPPTMKDLIGPQPNGRGKRGPDKKPRIRRAHQAEIIALGSEARREQMGSAKPLSFNTVRSTVLHSDQVMAEVPQKLGELLHRYFKFDWMPFHLEGLEIAFGGGKHVVNWPTDHAKSTTFDFHFPILSLMNDPDQSHILCGANIADAKSWVQTIQRELETNHDLIRDYPWVKRPALNVKAAWSTTELTVAGRQRNNRNPSVLALGAGSNDIRGRRGKFIGDDIEGEKHQYSPTERARLMNWIKLEVMRCYEDVHDSTRPLLLLCGTPFDVDSAYFKLESQGWQTHRRMVYTDEQPWRSTNPEDHRHAMLWPAKYEKVYEQWRDMTKGEFAIAYLMDPTIANPNRLTWQQIEELTAKAAEPKEPKTYVSLDAASGSANARADYAGLAVVRIAWPKDEQLPAVEVLEAHNMREGLFEQVRAAADLARKYGEGGKSCEVIYEVDGLGSVYANAFQHLAPDIRLLRSRTRDFRFETDWGITVIRTLVQKERLLIPASQRESEGMLAFKTEIRDLGGFGHDHISAAVWFVVRWLYRQVQQYNGPRFQLSYGAAGLPAQGGNVSSGGGYFGGRPAIAAYKRWGG